MRYDAFVGDAESLGDSARYNVKRRLKMPASPERGSREIHQTQSMFCGAIKKSSYNQVATFWQDYRNPVPLMFPVLF